MVPPGTSVGSECESDEMQPGRSRPTSTILWPPALLQLVRWDSDLERSARSRSRSGGGRRQERVLHAHPVVVLAVVQVLGVHGVAPERLGGRQDRPVPVADEKPLVILDR